MTTLFVALGVVFLAELGDKTQLAALGFGARHRTAPVLVGMAVGYGAANLLSVAIGGLLGAALPTRAIGIGGGIVFLAFALWTYLGDDDPAGDTPDDEASGLGATEVDAPATSAKLTLTGDVRLIASISTAIFIAELGDKTMLATATLAARGQPVLVWIGATAGMILSGAVGVVIGRFLGRRLPPQVTRIGAAVLFAVFGGALIVASI